MAGAQLGDRRILNAEGLPTPEGRSRWQWSYVDRLLHTRHVEELLRLANGDEVNAVIRQ
jgi:hypothetical protein